MKSKRKQNRTKRKRKKAPHTPTTSLQHHMENATTHADHHHKKTAVPLASKALTAISSLTSAIVITIRWLFLLPFVVIASAFGFIGTMVLAVFGMFGDTVRYIGTCIPRVHPWHLESESKDTTTSKRLRKMTKQISSLQKQHTLFVDEVKELRLSLKAITSNGLVSTTNSTLPHTIAPAIPPPPPPPAPAADWKPKVVPASIPFVPRSSSSSSSTRTAAPTKKKNATFSISMADILATRSLLRATPRKSNGKSASKSSSPGLSSRPISGLQQTGILRRIQAANKKHGAVPQFAVSLGDIKSIQLRSTPKRSSRSRPTHPQSSLKMAPIQLKRAVGIVRSPGGTPARAVLKSPSLSPSIQPVKLVFDALASPTENGVSPTCSPLSLVTPESTLITDTKVTVFATTTNSTNTNNNSNKSPTVTTTKRGVTKSSRRTARANENDENTSNTTPSTTVAVSAKNGHAQVIGNSNTTMTERAQRARGHVLQMR